MTRPTGRPKGRPQSTVGLFEEAAMERISLGHELCVNDTAERASLEWLRNAGIRTAALINNGRYAEAFEQTAAIIRRAESLLAYDIRENERHAALAAPVQVSMGVGQ